MAQSWSFDFGDTTGADLDAAADPDINAELAAAKDAAVALIPDASVYRVIARKDPNNPAGWSVEVRGPVAP